MTSVANAKHTEAQYIEIYVGMDVIGLGLKCYSSKDNKPWSLSHTEHCCTLQKPTHCRVQSRQCCSRIYGPRELGTASCSLNEATRCRSLQGKSGHEMPFRNSFFFLCMVATMTQYGALSLFSCSRDVNQRVHGYSMTFSAVRKLKRICKEGINLEPRFSLSSLPLLSLSRRQGRRREREPEFEAGKEFYARGRGNPT